jgi:hypothetical protein
VEYFSDSHLRTSHISIPALLPVGLKEHALHFAVFGLLTALTLMEGELQGAAGGQPGLEKSELDGGGCRRLIL